VHLQETDRIERPVEQELQDDRVKFLKLPWRIEGSYEEQGTLIYDSLNRLIIQLRIPRHKRIAEAIVEAVNNY